MYVPALTHSVACATPMLPPESARSSANAARDGRGTTITSTLLLTTVVGPLLPANCTSARLLIDVPGGAAAAAVESSHTPSKRRAAAAAPI